jgi:hypothetical protein
MMASSRAGLGKQHTRKKSKRAAQGVKGRHEGCSDAGAGARERVASAIDRVGNDHQKQAAEVAGNDDTQGAVGSRAAMKTLTPGPLVENTRKGEFFASGGVRWRSRTWYQ